MKNILLSFAITFGALSSTYAQEVYPCQTVEKTMEFVESLTEKQRLQYEIDQQSYDLEIQNFIANNPHLLAKSNGNSRGITYTIPVVFHIIHKDGPENISDEQVMNALQHMNDDFQKANSNWNQVNSNFLPIVADVEIEFKLAKYDNSGNCTNGITRTYSSVTEGGNGNSRIAAVRSQHGDWPGDRYLNIYVFKTMDIVGAAGYTYRPNNSIGSGMENGIHLVHNYVGDIGTAGSHGAHTLTHEVGHWLDLPHTWGNSNTPGLASNCNSDDGISDTPNTIGWTTCNRNGFSCSSLDNVENFMEYSYCSKMFTNGQKARMHAALNSSVGGRNNIHTSANLTRTGANILGVMCKADFKVDNQKLCPGESASFEDKSYSYATDWTWSFPGGTPSSSTNQNPVVTYNTPGIYEVTLSATDGTTTKSETKSAYITVSEHGATLPVLESFEDLSTLNGSFWSVDNQGNNAKFEITTTAAHTGSKSVVLKNFGQPSGNIDALVSNSVDLSNIKDDVTVSFRYAYRKRSTSNSEWLRFFISNSCREEWAQRKTLAGNALGSEVSTTSWTPTTQDDWVTVHITNIPSSYWVDNFRFKFEFESSGGNNLYLDDINIYSGTPDDEREASIDEYGLIKSFNVYPNPTDGIANVTFTLESNKNVNVSLVNIMGQTIQTNAIQAQAGSNLVMLDTESIQSGIYLVKVTTDGTQKVKRLVIK